MDNDALAAVREAHQPIPATGFCDADRQVWPCTTARLLVEIDSLRDQIANAEKYLRFAPITRETRDAARAVLGLK